MTKDEFTCSVVCVSIKLGKTRRSNYNNYLNIDSKANGGSWNQRGGVVVVVVCVGGGGLGRGWSVPRPQLKLFFLQKNNSN